MNGDQRYAEKIREQIIFAQRMLTSLHSMNPKDENLAKAADELYRVRTRLEKYAYHD